MIAHNEKFNYYFIQGRFKLVFNNNQERLDTLTNMTDNRTYVSWANYLRMFIDMFEVEGYDFNYIAEMEVITLVDKRDMTYEFYMKHNMSAIEWKINAMINKDKTLINKFPLNWKHPINTQFYCYRV